jgi:hypothetical protein
VNGSFFDCFLYEMDENDEYELVLEVEKEKNFENHNVEMVYYNQEVQYQTSTLHWVEF